jgi:hypothetical protein
MLIRINEPKNKKIKKNDDDDGGDDDASYDDVDVDDNSTYNGSFKNY